MGRMHTPGKGMSGSALPYKRSSPSWLKITSQEVKDIIAKGAPEAEGEEEARAPGPA